MPPEVASPVVFLGRPHDAGWVTALQHAMPDIPVVDADVLDDAAAAAIDIAIVTNPDPARLARFPNLRLLHAVWAGVEKLVPLARARDLPLVRLVDPMLASTMAEAVLAWTLYLHRDMPRYTAQQREKRWAPLDVLPLASRRVGILGMGEMGRAAAVALQRAGFAVTGWRASARSAPDVEGVRTISGEDGLAEVLSQSQILVVLLPLTPATTRLMNQTRLVMLPRGAALINFARGAVVDTDALVATLDSGHLSHAVLDVFEHEPLPTESPLWSHPAITVLPHISAPTNKASASAIVADNIRRYRMNGELPTLVNLQRGY